MKKEAIIFIESNTSGTGKLFLIHAKHLGYESIFFTHNPKRYSFDISKFAIPHVVDTNNIDQLLVSFKRFSKTFDIVSVISSSDYYIDKALYLSEKIGLKWGPSSDAVSSCRQKNLQRLKLKSAGIAIPAFEYISSLEEYLSVLTQLQMPLVIKPSIGSGSIGVKLCFTINEVKEHIALLFQQYSNKNKDPLEYKVLLEEYIEGPEYSVELFNEKVIDVTRKHITDPPFFVETGHDFPANITSHQKEIIEDISIKSVQALGLSLGPIHIELKMKNNIPVIIEVNPRLAGGHIPNLVYLSKGIDLIDATLLCSLRREVHVVPKNNRFSSIRFMIPQKNGKISKIENLQKIKKMSNIVDVEVYKKLPIQMEHNGSFQDRIGHIIACAEERVECIDSITLAMSQLRYHYSNFKEVNA